MYDPDVIPVVARMKFPANVHILSITSGENDVMPPHLFKKGETITKEVYLRILRTKPRVNRGWKLFPGGHISFSRTAYTSHLVSYWEARIPWTKHVHIVGEPVLAPKNSGLPIVQI